MMDKVLIDTDVILDFFFDRQPFSDHAAIVLSYCEMNKIEGYITPVILSNEYYLLRKTAKHELVIDKLRQLMTILNVLVIDKNSIIQAMNSGFKDFEDALQNFAAESADNISVILTRNTKDFKNSKLGVMTPESYVKL
jgi:predicted nucleic acid-binding protein